MQRGFSTIELLIASALALMFLSAMYVVSFGDQATVMNGETNDEAVNLTQKMVEQQQANGRQDFNLVNSTTSTDGIYTKTVTVNLLSDFLTKQVVASTTWKNDKNQTQNVTVSTLITNIDNVNSPNTCNSSLTNASGWKSPVYHYWDFLSLLPPPNSNGVPLTDIAVNNKKLYIVSNNPPNTIPQTFYVFSVLSDPSVAPTMLGRVDNNGASSEGLASLSIASTSNKIYAYVTNTRQANFNTCSPVGPSCAQLQIIDATTPTAPSVVTNFLVPTTTSPQVLGSGGQAVGKSVLYKDGFVYLGLTKTGSGPEFIILDAGGGGAGGTVTSPKVLGTFAVGFTVDDIDVKGNYAYLATTDTAAGNKRLLILNISDKTNPRLASSPVGGFFTASGIGVGNAVQVVGTKIFFGTAFSGAAVPNLYILDGTTPGSYPTSLTKYGSGTNTGSNHSVNGIIIRDYLAFVLSDDGSANGQFQIWNVSNPASPVPWTTSGLSSGFLNMSVMTSMGGSSFDCEGDAFYVALKTTQGNSKDLLGIITH